MPFIFLTSLSIFLKMVSVSFASSTAARSYCPVMTSALCTPLVPLRVSRMLSSLPGRVFMRR